ncbi:MAG: Galactonate dehydratase, partial [uncultured Thermomicrobiales bacterium]
EDHRGRRVPGQGRAPQPVAGQGRDGRRHFGRRRGRHLRPRAGDAGDARALRPLPGRGGPVPGRAPLADDVPGRLLRGRQDRRRRHLGGRHRPLGHPRQGARRPRLPTARRRLPRANPLLRHPRPVDERGGRRAGGGTGRGGVALPALHPRHGRPRLGRRRRRGLRAVRVLGAGRRLAAAGARGGRAEGRAVDRLPPPPLGRRGGQLLPAGGGSEPDVYRRADPGREPRRLQATADDDPDPLRDRRGVLLQVGVRAVRRRGHPQLRPDRRLQRRRPDGGEEGRRLVRGALRRHHAPQPARPGDDGGDDPPGGGDQQFRPTGVPAPPGRGLPGRPLPPDAGADRRRLPAADRAGTGGRVRRGGGGEPPLRAVGGAALAAAGRGVHELV